MRYLIFAGSNYYPSGGMDDLYAEYDDLQDVEDALKPLKTSRHIDWYHVYDTQSKERVYP